MQTLVSVDAVLGGGVSHRVGLYDQILLKDNHLAMVGSITEAVTRAKEYSGHHPGPDGQRLKIEVEVTDMGGAIEAAKTNPDIIMLDNMEPFEVEAVAKEVRNINPNIFPATLKADLLALQGDSGGRHIIKTMPYAVITVPIEDEHEGLDIDTRQQYATLPH